MNLLIRELMAQAGVDRPGQMSHMTAAGNTVMTHLLFGLDPKYIRESPYTPGGQLRSPGPGPGSRAGGGGSRLFVYLSPGGFLCGRGHRRRRSRLGHLPAQTPDPVHRHRDQRRNRRRKLRLDGDGGLLGRPGLRGRGDQARNAGGAGGHRRLSLGSGDL